ncbi:hypothetical protein BHE74_00001040 [Ensete ventricosum]|nr:hypothetical protein BHE74_00001040 [Ensete ventricosum]
MDTIRRSATTSKIILKTSFDTDILCRYVRDHQTPLKGRPTRDSLPHLKGPIKKQIDVIVGGRATGGNNSSVRKAYARSIMEKRPKRDRDPEITFGLGNEEYPDHDDALVISTQITNVRVKRIMIDMGTMTMEIQLFNSELPLPALTYPNTSPGVILNAVQQERPWELGVSTARCCVIAG